MQLPPDDALVMISGTPPIRARKLRFFADHNFAKRCLPPPKFARAARPAMRPNDWTDIKRPIDYRLQLPWSDHVVAGGRRRDLANEQELLPLREDWRDFDRRVDCAAGTERGGGPGSGRDPIDDISGL